MKTAIITLTAFSLGYFASYKINERIETIKPERCKHGKQWEQFMFPDSFPVIIHLEDGTRIIHDKWMR